MKILDFCVVGILAYKAQESWFLRNMVKRKGGSWVHRGIVAVGTIHL